MREERRRLTTDTLTGASNTKDTKKMKNRKGEASARMETLA
jgi:hypothetical protein